MNSMSLAILASFIDATLDFISGLMIYFTWRMKHCRDKYSYPVGQSRMEPLGVIGMACLMTSATIVTLQESITTLVGGEENLNFSGLTPTVILFSSPSLTTRMYLFLFILVLSTKHSIRLCAPQGYRCGNIRSHYKVVFVPVLPW